MNCEAHNTVGARIAQSVQWLHYRTEDWGIVLRFLAGASVLFSKASRLAIKLTQPHIQWVSGAPFPRCEPIHSKPSGDVRNEWSLTSTLYFLILYRRTTLHLHDIKIFYREFNSAESERVVISDEAESCIVGIISLGTTSTTSEVVLWNRQYLDRFHC
jgi:hypothetical protein